MQILNIQVFALFSLLYFSEQAAIKRSPLELGYVSFSQIPALVHPKHMNGSIVPAASTGTSYLHPKNIWVPGHVSHHAYIPGHHVIVPAHAVVVSRTIHTILVRPHGGSRIEIYEEAPGFRTVYGGFGVGYGVGGHGAGHGFQVVF